MSAAHTPGPWKVVSDSTARELDLFEIADVSHLRVICDGNTNGYDIAGSPEADARLIAAAPKLLAALKTCLINGSMTGDDWVIEKAERAIEEATGAPA